MQKGLIGSEKDRLLPIWPLCERFTQHFQFPDFAKEIQLPCFAVKLLVPDLAKVNFAMVDEIANEAEAIRSLLFRSWFPLHDCCLKMWCRGGVQNNVPRFALDRDRVSN